MLFRCRTALCCGVSLLASAAHAQTAPVTPPVTSAPLSAYIPPAPLPPLPPPPAPLPSERNPIAAPPSSLATPLPSPTLRAPAGPIDPLARTRSRRAPTLDQGGGGLPAPADRPLSIDLAGDPVLGLGRLAGAAAPFRDAVAAAVDRNPSLAEAEASADEAAAARREARAGLFPTADLNVTSFATIDRNFSNDPDNIIERSRPRNRTDAQLAVNQTLVDFGATSIRIGAASARVRAAAAAIDDAAAQVALRTIGAWYQVFVYRTLLTIARTYRDAQSERRGQVEQRITQGVAAEVDMTRLDSSLAAIDTRIARFQRSLATAEAQYRQLTGQPAPEVIRRAPALGMEPATEADARDAVSGVPAVQASAEQADAARNDARAAGRDLLPNVSTGIDAGRYGLFENQNDYDIRARVTLRKRFGGGIGARQDQIAARAQGAAARAARIRTEAERDAAVAWADVRALEQQTVALEESYVAARQARDATEQRFVVSRGTLFDVIDVNDAYFGAAANYVESLADRDAAHYVLLARTGRLLSALDIRSEYQPSMKGGR